MEGDCPKSPVKIAGIVAVILIIVAFLYWFSRDDDRGYAGIQNTWTAEAATELGDEEEIPWDYLEDSLPT